jgi:hypothetical protein
VDSIAFHRGSFICEKDIGYGLRNLRTGRSPSSKKLSESIA